MLNLRTIVTNFLADAHTSERGQMLVLFVALFTVILALAAFAVDQGFWFGRRRVVSTTADLASRGGSIAYFGSTLVPCEEAAHTAVQNGLPYANPTDCSDGSLGATKFSPVAYDDAQTIGSISECVKSDIETEVPGLFAGAFGIGSIDIGLIDIGASSTACVGTSYDLRVAANSGLEGLPIVLADGGSRDCFNGNFLDPGRECVIWASMDSVEIGLDDAIKHNRLLWDDEHDCLGNVQGSSSEIQNGVSWACDFQDNVHASYVSQVNGGGVDHRDMRAAMQARLAQSTTCASLEPGAGPASSFRNAFGRADGLDGVNAVPPPPFPGGSGPRDAIYVQEDCFDNPRIVVVPFSNRPATSSENKDVDGFAVVYITGCYPSDEPLHDNQNAEVETDTCQDWPAPSDDDLDRDCRPEPPAYTPSLFCRYEIRGVPLRLFLTREAVGRLGDMTATKGNDFPLTIQTMQD